MSDDDVLVQHESFGQVLLSRVNSTVGLACYGSKLKHSQFVELRIHRSEMRREYTHERHYQRDHLVTVRLTENQFAEMITTLNMGGGVPCTITRLNRTGVPEPVFENEMDQVHDEFAAKAREATATLSQAMTKLVAMTSPNGKMTKGALNDLQKDLEEVVREIGQNMPYMSECFAETMDKVVTSAKQDIEAHLMTAMQRAKALGAAPEDIGKVSLLLDSPK